MIQNKLTPETIGRVFGTIMPDSDGIINRDVRICSHNSTIHLVFERITIEEM